LQKSIALSGWDAGQKRALAMTMQTDYPVKTIYAVLDLARSSFYHTRAVAEDGDLRAALLDLAGDSTRPMAIAV
jgi:hypothetical protein